jgi:hypothetical protein
MKGIHTGTGCRLSIDIRRARGSEGRELIDLEKRKRLIRLAVGSVSSGTFEAGLSNRVGNSFSPGPNPGSPPN